MTDSLAERARAVAGECKRIHLNKGANCLKVHAEIPCSCCQRYKRILAFAEEVRTEGANWMLDSIRASLEGYPNHGGDIVVMKEVDRLREEVRRETLEEEAAAELCGRCAEKIPMESETYHVGKLHCYAWAIRALAQRKESSQ